MFIFPFNKSIPGPFVILRAHIRLKWRSLHLPLQTQTLTGQTTESSLITGQLDTFHYAWGQQLSFWHAIWMTSTHSSIILTLPLFCPSPSQHSPYGTTVLRKITYMLYRTFSFVMSFLWNAEYSEGSSAFHKFIEVSILSVLFACFLLPSPPPFFFFRHSNGERTPCHGESYPFATHLILTWRALLACSGLLLWKWLQLLQPECTERVIGNSDWPPVYFQLLGHLGFFCWAKGNDWVRPGRHHDS